MSAMVTTLLITEPSVRARLARSSASSDGAAIELVLEPRHEQAGDAHQRVADDDGREERQALFVRPGGQPAQVQAGPRLEAGQFEGREDQDGEDQQEGGAADEPQRPAHERARARAASRQSRRRIAAAVARRASRAPTQASRVTTASAASTYFQSAWPSNTRFHIGVDSTHLTQGLTAFGQGYGDPP